METLASSSNFRHTILRVETQHPTAFIDLTDDLQALVMASGFGSGLINVQSLHTTTAIIVNEHEPLLLTDMAALLEGLAPQRALYRHDDFGLRTVNYVPGERSNGHSHCRALLLGPSVCLNMVGGRLQLGKWQRVFLAELDGPRTREVSVLLIGDRNR